MQVTLYKAAEELRDLLDEIDPETGEFYEGIDRARSLVERKSKAVAAYILQTEAEADFVEQHAKAMMDRARTARKRSAWLKTYLRENMAATGVLSIKSDDGTFSAKLERERDESVDVFDEKQLPSDYTREVPAKYEPDKTLIKKALKDGYDVPGARLVKKDRLTLK